MRAGIVLALLAVILITGCTGQPPSDTSVFSPTVFANCLSQSGIKVYTASWCETCQAQKQLFGEGWDTLNSVECGTQGESGTFNEKCVQAGITGVPIWELKNGTRIGGLLTTYQLNLLTGCTGMVPGNNTPGNGITFTGPPPLTATVGQPFTFSLCQPDPVPIDATCGGLRPATNPTGGKPPYSMSVKLGGGFLPPGIALNLDGWLTGTPTKEGTYPFTVCARDGFGEEGCVPVTITVNPAQTPAPSGDMPETWTGTGIVPIAFESSGSVCSGKQATATFSLTINSPHSLVSALHGEKEITLWSTPNYEGTSGTVSGTVEVTAQPPKVRDDYYCVISGGNSPTYQITFMAMKDQTDSHITIGNADGSFKGFGTDMVYENGGVRDSWELAFIPATWTVTSISDTSVSGTIESGTAKLDKGTFTLSRTS